MPYTFLTSAGHLLFAQSHMQTRIRLDITKPSITQSWTTGGGGGGQGGQEIRPIGIEGFDTSMAVHKPTR